MSADCTGDLFLTTLRSYRGTALCRGGAKGRLASGLMGPQEAATHIARVNVVSRNRVTWVVGEGDGALAGASARALNIERVEGAARNVEEAAIHRARVNVVSFTRPRRGEAWGGMCRWRRPGCRTR